MKLQASVWKGAPLGLAFATLFSCQIKEEKEYPNLLTDKPRILAIRSVPADIPLGETGELSALVYLPDSHPDCSDTTPKYRWSWCPLRAGAEENFACTISEEEMQTMWEDLGGTVPLPAYDLGDTPTVDYLNLFGDYAIAVCVDEINGTDESSQLEFYNCVESLQVSVRLDVRWCGERRIAIRDLSLLGEEETNDEDFEPNLNPSPQGVLTFSPEGDPGTDLTGDDPLEVNVTYSASIELDEGGDCGEDDPPEDCVAQTFTPPPIPGISDNEPRKETLTMSWFLTKGNTSPQTLDGEDYQPDTDSNEGQNTFYIDGDEDIRVMLGNIVSMEDADPGEGELYIVLRDERGGIDWAIYSFTVEEAD